MTNSGVGHLDSRGLIAAVALGTMGALTIMVVPGFVMLVSTLAPLSDRDLGYVAAWNINAVAVAVGIATFLIARFDWRHLALAGLGLIVIGNLWTAGSDTYASIVAARVCTGLGEGLAIAVSFAALGSAANPDRAFGIYLVVGLSVSAAVLAVLPALQEVVGSPAVFVGVTGVALATGALLAWLPACTPRAVTWKGEAPKIATVPAVCGLVAVFLYFIAQGAMWSYFERIGVASGVESGTIGRAMGISSLAGMGGALLAVFVCTRMSRTWPLIFSGCLSVLSFWMLKGHVTGAMLIVAGILFNFAWNLAQPLFSGVCAQADARGRVVTAMGCIQTVGYGAGPALAATLLHGNDYSPIVWMSTTVLVMSLVVILAGARPPRGRVLPVPA